MKRDELSITTGNRRGLFDLTSECAEFVRGEGDGMLAVFVPHATAGLVIMELGSGSEEDLLATLDRLLPRDDRWRHRHGAVGHGADHVVPLLAPPSLTVPVVDGRLQLGDVAVDSSAGHQRRQPGAPRQPVFPTRLGPRSFAARLRRVLRAKRSGSGVTARSRPLLASIHSLSTVAENWFSSVGTSVTRVR